MRVDSYINNYVVVRFFTFDCNHVIVTVYALVYNKALL